MNTETHYLQTIIKFHIDIDASSFVNKFNLSSGSFYHHFKDSVTILFYRDLKFLNKFDIRLFYENGNFEFSVSDQIEHSDSQRIAKILLMLISFIFDIETANTEITFENHIINVTKNVEIL